jgi:hypothetical protein
MYKSRFIIDMSKYPEKLEAFVTTWSGMFRGIYEGKTATMARFDGFFIRDTGEKPVAKVKKLKNWFEVECHERDLTRIADAFGVDRKYVKRMR